MDITSTERAVPDPVRQFSVFMENKVGRLCDVVKILGRSEVHVLAMTTIDTTDSAVSRLVVDDPVATRLLFLENAIAFAESEILAVEIAGEHDIERVLSALLEAEINIHYIYSFVSRPMGRSALAVNLEDIDLATHILNTRNVKVLSQRDISR